MLMHTRGILVMMPEGAMVLTGKTALDYSGSVSAEDNLGIGGYEHIMGPNGQAQYLGARPARRVPHPAAPLRPHATSLPGERFPRRARDDGPADARRPRLPARTRGPGGFATVGDVFSDEHNPGRKKPFDIRRVMLAVTDQDHPPLERWAGLARRRDRACRGTRTSAAIPVCLLGFESRPVPRLGLVPADGPEQWTSGTLFPMSSKKIARAINAASGNRPLVILANLSGFDGSPESMRRRQLEFGAEIGRAVVNFKGPIVFVVVSRYHGGAFVVFSQRAERQHGGRRRSRAASPRSSAARRRRRWCSRARWTARTKKDARVAGASRRSSRRPPTPSGAALRARLVDVIRSVRSEKLGEVADEFDRIHSVHRALKVGSLDRIISAAELRPYLIDAIERGMAREMERSASMPTPIAVILARGLGTRMRKADPSAGLGDAQARVADTGVKAMIPIGRPFLDYVLSGLADAGITDVCLVIGPEHDAVREYYGAHGRARAGARRLRRPAASRRARPTPWRRRPASVGDRPFLVMNSDNYYPVDAFRALAAMRRARAWWPSSARRCSATSNVPRGSRRAVRPRPHRRRRHAGRTSSRSPTRRRWRRSATTSTSA